MKQPVGHADADTSPFRAAAASFPQWADDDTIPIM
jgi:hypothetical protein